MALAEIPVEDRLPDLTWRLSRDIKRAASQMSPREVRYVVDLYYQLQEFRMSSANMVRSAPTEPNALLSWFADRTDELEGQIPLAMKVYAASRRDGRWCLSIRGVGPVITAGMLASFDIERAPTAGHFWSFAGLNPEMKWEKGRKRPFSARLKVLCWKLGQSFIKSRTRKAHVEGCDQCGCDCPTELHPEAHYGRLYEERKAEEIARNLAGEHKGKSVRKNGRTDTVEELPPFIIDLRAQRYAVKLFLSHLHHVMYECQYGTIPPKPYILTQPGHAHFMGPPNWPCE